MMKPNKGNTKLNTCIANLHLEVFDSVLIFLLDKLVNLGRLQ